MVNFGHTYQLFVIVIWMVTHHRLRDVTVSCKLSFVLSPLLLVWKCPHQVIHICENQFTYIQ